ncbi:MAG: peptidoglycan-binding protein LysM [Saprospiraceae bacterium]|nr:peptidoglycan-binding protein LysM [Saprospiraceae bacterium]
MGLFSFLKGAGARLFDRKEAEPATPTAPSPEVEAALRQQKIMLLRGALSDLGLEVTDLSLDLVGEQVTVYGEVDSQANREKVVLALGNVYGISSVDDRLSVVIPEPESRFHEVKKGDTLSAISKTHYGSWKHYPAIFEANKPMLSDPDKIYPGQMLRIPVMADVPFLPLA